MPITYSQVKQQNSGTGVGFIYNVHTSFIIDIGY